MNERTTKGEFVSFNDLMQQRFTQIENEKPITYQDGDYLKDGLWYCGKCNTPKQVKTETLGIVNCLCRCKAIERDENIKEENRKQFIERNIQFIDPDYRNIYFKNSDNQQTIEFAKNFVNNFTSYFKPNNIGLFIYGEFGNGKTYIASMIANELIEKGQGVIMTPVNKAIELYDTSSQFREAISTQALVILDDFGMSRTTDYQTERLCNLINARYQAKKPIIVTTNLNRQQLVETQDLNLARVYDRIIEMTHPVFIKTSGRRKEISRERFNKVEEMLKGE